MVIHLLSYELVEVFKTQGNVYWVRYQKFNNTVPFLENLSNTEIIISSTTGLK